MANGGGDDKVRFVVDFDTRQALEKLTGLVDRVGDLGEKDNLKGLTEGLLKVGAFAGVLGATFYGLKTAMDLTFEAENIKAINYQFEILSKNAGVAADVLREDLGKASGGLADDTDIIKAANKALAQMSTNAERLGDVMDLARKMTLSFGGELIDNFEALNQAIATGNMRSLRQMGIVIDSEKAVKKYADAHNILKGELTQAGEQQARLNAVLEQGNKATAGANAGVKEATNAWKQFKVAITETFEVFVLLWDKTLGNVVRKMMNVAADMARSLKSASLLAFGEEHEKAAIKVNSLNKEIERTQKTLNGYKKDLSTATTPKQIENATKLMEFQEGRLKSLTAELSKYSAKLEGTKTAKTGSTEEAATKTPTGDDAKIKERKAKDQLELVQLELQTVRQREAAATDLGAFLEAKSQEKVLLETKAHAEIARLDAETAEKGRAVAEFNNAKKKELIEQSALEQDRIQQEIALRYLQNEQTMIDAATKTNEAKIQATTEFSNLEDLFAARRKLLREEEDNQISLIDSNRMLTLEQREQIRQEVEQRYSMQRVEMAQRENDQKIKAIDNFQKSSELSAKTVTSGWTKSALEVGTLNQNMGKVGTKAFDSLGNEATAAFTRMAKGGKFAADEMLKAVLGQIGQEAIARGTFMTLASIFPPNPAGLAAGTGLIALGMGLTAASGGGATAAPATGGGGGEAARDRQESLSIDNAAQPRDLTGMERVQRAVTVQVQGNYFETEQTRRQLMDMMRQESDATDFKYVGTGGAW